MHRADDCVAELLRLPVAARAQAARALLESLDDDDDDDDNDVELAHVTELMQRMHGLETGEVKLVAHSDARARVVARLRSIRGE